MRDLFASLYKETNESLSCRRKKNHAIGLFGLRCMRHLFIDHRHIQEVQSRGSVGRLHLEQRYARGFSKLQATGSTVEVSTDRKTEQKLHRGIALCGTPAITLCAMHQEITAWVNAVPFLSGTPFWNATPFLPGRVPSSTARWRSEARFSQAKWSRISYKGIHYSIFKDLFFPQESSPLLRETPDTA